MAGNNTGLKASVAVIAGLIVIVAGWALWNSRALASSGREIATNTANISNVQEDIKEMKGDVKELLRRTPER